jgi:hypothetical protein
VGPGRLHGGAIRRGSAATTVICVLLACAGIAVAYHLTVGGARHHAAGSVAFMKRFVPRATGSPTNSPYTCCSDGRCYLAYGQVCTPGSM